MADLVTIGFKAETDGLVSAEKQLEKTAKAGDKLDKTNSRVVKSSKNTSRQLGRVGKSAGQAGIQVQQFVGQLQGGINPMVALSQQGADLGFVLGFPLAGAIAGIGASLVGLLIPNLIQSESKVKALVDSINDLKSASGIAADQARLLSQEKQKEVEELSKQNEEISKQIIELEKLQRLRTERGAGPNAGTFSVPLSAAQNQEKYADAIKETREELTQLKAQLTTNNKLMENLSNESADLTGEQGRVSDSVKQLTQSLEVQILTLSDGALQGELYAAALATGGSSIEDLDPAVASLITKVSELKKEQAGAAATAKLIETEYGLLDASTARLLDKIDPLAKAQREYNAAYDELLGLFADTDDDRILGLFEKLDKQFDSITKKVVEAKTETGEWEKITERAADRIDQAFADVWLSIGDGFKGVTDSLLNGFKRLLAEMAHAAITKPIAINIAAALGFGGTSGSAIAGQAGGIGQALGGGGLGGAGSLLGGLGGLGGAFGQLGVGFGGTTSLLGAGSLSGAIANIGGLFSSGSIVAGIGAALPLIGIVAGGLSLVDSLAGGKLFGSSYETTGNTLNLDLSRAGATGFTRLEESRERSFFRGTRTRFTDTPIDTAAISQVFTSLQDSIVDAAELLDISTVSETVIHSLFEDFGGKLSGTLSTTVEKPLEQWLAEFDASLRLDIEGLTDEEIQQEITEFLARTSDEMITAVFGDFISQIQMEGETTTDALNRVILNMRAVTSTLDALGLEFDLTGKSAALASTNIVNLIGGLDALTELSNQYYQSFFTQEERFLILQSNLSESFSELGHALPQTRMEFRSLVEGLDLTTESGQAMFAALMQLSPSLGALFDQIDQASQESVLNARSRLDEAERVLRDLVDGEKRAADERLDAARDLFDSQMSLINEQRRVTEDAYAELLGTLDLTSDALRSSFGAEAERIRIASDERIQSLNDEIKAAQDLSSERLAAIGAEKSAVSSSMNLLINLANRLRQSVGIGNTDVEQALAAARRGDFSLAETLQVQAIGQERFTTLTDQSFAQAVQRSQVGEIADLASGRASALERQLSALDNQRLSIEAGTAATVAALEQQIEVEQVDAQARIDALNQQLNLLLGIDTNILSIPDAISQFMDAQIAIDQFGYEEQIAALDAQEILAEQQLQQAVDAHDAEIERLDGILEANLGLADAAISIEEAIINLNQAILELAEAQQEPPPSPPPRNTPGGDIRDQPVMIGQLEIMNQKLNDGLNAIAKHTATTAGTLKRIELDGLDTRAEA